MSISWENDDRCDHLVEETYKKIWLSFTNVEWEQLEDSIMNIIIENCNHILDLENDGFFDRTKQELLFTKKLNDKFDYFSLIKLHPLDELTEDDDETIKKEITLAQYLINKLMQENRSNLKDLLDNIKWDGDVGFI